MTKLYYAIHDDHTGNGDGEPVRYTTNHKVVIYETEQEAQEDNPKNIILEAHIGETVDGEKVLLNSLNEIVY